MQELININRAFKEFDLISSAMVYKLKEEFEDYGKDFKRVRKVQTDCSINGAMQQQNNV